MPPPEAPVPPRLPRDSFFATYLPTFHWAVTKGTSLFQRRGEREEASAPPVAIPPLPPRGQEGIRPMPESKTALRREAPPEMIPLAPLPSRPSTLPQPPVQRGTLGPVPESKTTLRREAPATEIVTPVPAPSTPLTAPAVAVSPSPVQSSFFQTYLPTFFSFLHRGEPATAAPVAPSPISGGVPEPRLTLEPVPKKGSAVSLDALLKEGGAPAAQGLPQGGRLTYAGKPGEKTEEEMEAMQKAIAEIRQESSPIRSLDAKADPEFQAKQDAAAQKLLKELEEERREQERLAKKEKKIAAKQPEKSKEEPVIQKIKLKRRTQSGLSAFLQSIQYIGAGKERLAIIQNLATMMNAGLPLVDSLKTLRLEMRSKPVKKLMQRVVDSVENGSPFWRALDAQHFFSPHAIALIRIGEESGDLAENMEYLAAQQEKDQALRSKVKMAMIYPSIVIVLMFIVVMGLGLFVLPNLVQVLFSLNVELPLVTRVVIEFTEIFTTYGTVIVPGSVGGVIVLIILAKFTPLRVVSQWIIFRIPGIGRLAREATIARFGVILGGLLKAGVPLVEALHSLAEVTPIVSYRKFYVHLLEHITIGDSFAKSFAALHKSGKLLPPSVQQLVMTGERSGSLSEILLKIASIYEKKANETAQKLPVILEPIILLFIGALVGTIAFAIIIPIYSIVGNVGH